MSSRPTRIRIEYIWIAVSLVCAVLFGFASIRRSRHAGVLMLHLEQLEEAVSRSITQTNHPAQRSNELEDDLASRSRAQFAVLLGLGNSSSARIELESEKWKPMIIRNCTEDMAPYYAPCLTKIYSNLEYGEEIVYPDFEAAMPGFFSLNDGQAWLQTNYGPEQQGQTSSNKRVIVDMRQGRLVFTGLRGQNLIFKNVRYVESLLPTSWVPDSSHCLGHMTSTASFHGQAQQAGADLPEDAEVMETEEEAAVYITPDSERYQHWLDHTTKPLMQSAHLITNKTRIFPGSMLSVKQPIVQMMWRWLPHINQSQIRGTYNEVLRVKRLLVSCRVPYVHPYLFFRLQEMVLGPEAPRVPLAERKVVVWYSRSSKDTARQNQGREIMNEAEVLVAIRQLLEERGLGERLEIHPPSAYQDPLDYVRYLNRNAAALLGPHGGGLCNFKWLATNTLVLELMPRSWISTPLYEEAIGHGLNYWVDLLESQNGQHDMMANVPNIIALLKAELGKEPTRGPIIRYRYDWPAVLEDAVREDKSRAAYFSSMEGRCCNNAPGDHGSEGMYVLPQQQ